MSALTAELKCQMIAACIYRDTLRINVQIQVYTPDGFLQVLTVTSDIIIHHMSPTKISLYTIIRY